MKNKTLKLKISPMVKIAYIDIPEELKGYKYIACTTRIVNIPEVFNRISGFISIENDEIKLEIISKDVKENDLVEFEIYVVADDKNL